MTSTSLTREIGTAERSLGRLLEPRLAAGGLRFDEWTVLVLLAAGPLSLAEVRRRQDGGRVGVDAVESVARLAGRGLVDAADPEALTMTPAGARAFSPVRDAVATLTARLFDDLPAADVAATRRVLAAVAERAAALA